ncbi:MAG TPA: primosomal protein N', partial [Clostridiales bacterium]|nr:primosomal protein N' [Clostridiales bacterium]
MIAEVIIDSRAKKLNRKFDYEIPKNLEDLIFVGSRVLVPFANFKSLEQGYVIRIKEKTDFEVKQIAGLEENLPEDKINLARWMARKYFTNVSECIKLMLTPGTKSKDQEKRVKDRTFNFVYLNIPYEEIDFEKIRGEKQKKLLQFLKKNEGLTISEIESITEISRATVNSLIDKKILKIENKKIDRNPLINKNVQTGKKLKLTEEQKEAYQVIEKAIDENRYEEFLLYGVTGSGKTEVYLQLIEKTIKTNKSAIMLVPEISLTPQMIDRFVSRFSKEQVAVLHSKLSIGERHDEWERIKNNEAKIVIGARSAIFAPFENLGLIIIDEEHDMSYKSEGAPRYSAKEVASFIGKNKKIPVVLGSATPDLNTFYNAEKGKITKLSLTKRANNSNLPDVTIVDLKQELAVGNKSMISNLLYDEIENNLKNKKQTILFLNRRGYSTFIMCRDCGYTLKCPNCNISLTYHRTNNLLKCHYCGHTQKVATVCPNCNSTKIRYFGTGTQKLEQEIHRLFPEASTIRMDIDTVTKKNSHEHILNTFKNENIDILIGTQMVVKGHHFPNVTLVGVIAADGSLNQDDFRANEKTFQILTQVAGRAGREKLPGKVIIQTYNPNSFAIECSKEQNYDIFYNTEIILRKQLKYPPFCDIIMIGFSGENEKEIKDSSTYVYNLMKKNLEKYDIKVFPAMPSPIDKIQNKLRWRIIAKGK